MKKKILEAAVFVLLALVTGFIINVSTVKADDSMYVDENGNLTVTGNINGGFNIVPIGTILAWHKNLTDPPLTLPDGFV